MRRKAAPGEPTASQRPSGPPATSWPRMRSLAEDRDQLGRLPRVFFEVGNRLGRQRVEPAPVEARLDGRAEIEMFQILGIVVIGADLARLDDRRRAVPGRGVAVSAAGGTVDAPPDAGAAEEQQEQQGRHDPAEAPARYGGRLGVRSHGMFPFRSPP